MTDKTAGVCHEFFYSMICYSTDLYHIKKMRPPVAWLAHPSHCHWFPHHPYHEGTAFHLISHAAITKYLKLFGFSFACFQKCFLFLSLSPSLPSIFIFLFHLSSLLLFLLFSSFSKSFYLSPA